MQIAGCFEIDYDRLRFLEAALNLARAERNPDLPQVSVADSDSYQVEDLARAVEILECCYQ